jgi:hypothetical protein
MPGAASPRTAPVLGVELETPLVLAAVPAPTPEAPIDFWESLVTAAREASHNVGALLSMTAASVGVGGIIERSQVMSLLPAQMGNPLLVLTVLVGVLILVGMLTDGYGAVILVSGAESML